MASGSRGRRSSPRSSGRECCSYHPTVSSDRQPQASESAVSGTVDERREPGDATQKSYRRILAEEIEEGLHELRRPNSGLFLSALSAGLDIGFGPLLMAVTMSHSTGEAWPLVENVVVATAYAIGFVLVILGRSDLFTEHTVLSMLPVLDGHATLRDLGRVWGLIYVGNLVGCFVFVPLTFVVGPGLNVVDPGAFVEIGNVLVAYSWWMTFLGAVLAGWLMGLLSWLVVAARDTIGTIVVIWAVAGAIGFAHLPHSIAGTVEVLFGVLGSAEITIVDYLNFLFWSTSGNVVGGVVFVALLKYSHVTRSGEKPEIASVSDSE